MNRLMLSGNNNSGPSKESIWHRRLGHIGERSLRCKRANTVLNLVHSDVCGKMSTQSLGGAEYFLTFIDDRSPYTCVYVLKHKSEVLQKFKEWKALVETSSGHKLKLLRTDNGGEYCYKEFEKYCKREGVRHELTVPKHRNRTVLLNE